MKKKIILFLVITFFLALLPAKTFAEQKASGSSAILTVSYLNYKEDTRAIVLKKFLEQYNSPLAPYSDVFVREADKNGLDWKMVAAISGVESTFGWQLPEGSYNAWGWGIYGNNMIVFSSYPEAIKIISQSLRENYINRWGATDVYGIGKMYAASPTWASHVSYWMNKIDQFAKLNQENTLSLSL